MHGGAGRAELEQPAAPVGRVADLLLRTSDELPHLALAALGATVAYYILGGLVFTLLAMRQEFGRYPAVYRTQSMKSVWPLGILGMALSMVALVALFALAYPGSSTYFVQWTIIGAVIALIYRTGKP